MTEEKKTSDFSMSVPMAIVIAGALIAGALYFGGNYSGGGLTAGIGGAENIENSEATDSNPDVINVKPVGSDDHIVGNPAAKITIVEYSDTECPFCKIFHESMNQIMDKYGKSGNVAWVYRHFPLAQLHRKAVLEAEATECAFDQGGQSAFWDYINTIFEITPSNDGLPESALSEIAQDLGLDIIAFNECLDSGKNSNKIQEAIKDAVAAGGSGTPYNVFILRDPLDKDMQGAIVNALAGAIGPRAGELIDFYSDPTIFSLGGAMPTEALEAIIDTILES